MGTRVVLEREVVDAIQAALAAGMPRTTAAMRFGVPEWSVRRIIWGRVHGKPPTPAAEAERWEPVCMEPDEWTSWLAANRELTFQRDQARRPCADCPLGHAAEMRAVGRCNGEPEDVAEDPDQAEDAE